MGHPVGIPAELRRDLRRAGAAQAAIGYLVDLGVTTVELLPVHQNVPESFLVAEGLTNYWGYNTIGFFAPHNGYSAAVRAGPGGRSGRRVQGDGGRAAPGRPGSDPGRGVQPHRRGRAGRPHAVLPWPRQPGLLPDRARQPRPLLRHDRLRQRAERRRPGHAAADDGLAALLADRDARRRFPVRPGPHPGPPGRRLRQGLAFLDMCSQDPVVCQAKLVAEPWDVGQMDSYDLGRFPPLWREWNGKYRDTMRDFWRSHRVGIGEFADRFSGSADLYATVGRRPTASVNLITVDDGFTLRDLVSYDDKHNEANGENNRDGTSDNIHGTAGRRPDRRPRRAGAARTPVPRHARHTAPVVRRADAAGRRRDWAGPSRATTTPTARTTRSPGLTGPSPTLSCRTTPSGLSPSARPTRRSAAVSFPAPKQPSCNGSPRQAPR